MKLTYQEIQSAYLLIYEEAKRLKREQATSEVPYEPGTYAHTILTLADRMIRELYRPQF
jgi:hypothetical protein